MLLSQSKGGEADMEIRTPCEYNPPRRNPEANFKDLGSSEMNQILSVIR